MSVARLSRRRGPTANFALDGTFRTITGLSISRAFDDGELVILARAQVRNDSGVVQLQHCRLVLDGVEIPNSPTLVLADAVELLASLSTYALQAIAAGPHTIELQARQAAGATNVILANTGELAVIQLPVWDTTDDLT